MIPNISDAYFLISNVVGNYRIMWQVFSSAKICWYKGYRKYLCIYWKITENYYRSEHDQNNRSIPIYFVYILQVVRYLFFKVKRLLMKRGVPMQQSKKKLNWRFSFIWFSWLGIFSIDRKLGSYFKQSSVCIPLVSNNWRDCKQQLSWYSFI